MISLLSFLCCSPYPDVVGGGGRSLPLEGKFALAVVSPKAGMAKGARNCLAFHLYIKHNVYWSEGGKARPNGQDGALSRGPVRGWPVLRFSQGVRSLNIC